MKNVSILFGKSTLSLDIPEDTDILIGQDAIPIQDTVTAFHRAFQTPIGAPALRDLVRRKRPKTVAITISDITRPVPNKAFLPPLLDLLNQEGIEDAQITLIVGTGMHRGSTTEERETMVGKAHLNRVQLSDHAARAPETLVTVCEDPLVRVNRRFAEADLRIVSGLIEPHFMAGFSGGRKGVCPALVDLPTIQRFHSFATLRHPLAHNGVLDGNPCHEIALEVAQRVGVDFLVNVALTRKRELAGIYCGDLIEAHLAGCQEVAHWSSAKIDRPYDLVITSGGGFPLDRTFYQTVKGMVGALEALAPHSTLLQISPCEDQLGSHAYHELLMHWKKDWAGFLTYLAAHPDQVLLDQWEFQMQCKVLECIGLSRLWFVSDGLPFEIQKDLALTPILGPGDVQRRAQGAINRFLEKHPGARVAVIPDGPYTMLRI